jgi:hypothetical protein
MLNQPSELHHMPRQLPTVGQAIARARSRSALGFGILAGIWLFIGFFVVMAMCLRWKL